MDVGVIPNFTLFVQAALFLLFVLLLNFIYVKPYSRIIEERERIVKRNLEEASSLREEAKNHLKKAEEILESARTSANSILESAKKEAAKIKNEILEKAEAEAEAETARRVQEIRVSLEEEKKKLDHAVRELAQSIVKKILGEAA